MAFTAKILSWHFRHVNIVGCLLKRRPTNGGSRAPQDPPPPPPHTHTHTHTHTSYAPVFGPRFFPDRYDDLPSNPVFES